MRDPDGHRVEIYTQDYYTGDPDNPVVTWDVHDNQRRDWWGNPVVPSWYTDASLVLDLDGKPQPLTTRTDDSEMGTSPSAPTASRTPGAPTGRRRATPEGRTPEGRAPEGRSTSWANRSEPRSILDVNGGAIALGPFRPRRLGGAWFAAWHHPPWVIRVEVAGSYRLATARSSQEPREYRDGS